MPCKLLVLLVAGISADRRFKCVTAYKLLSRYLEILRANPKLEIAVSGQRSAVSLCAALPQKLGGAFHFWAMSAKVKCSPLLSGPESAVSNLDRSLVESPASQALSLVGDRDKDPH